MRTHTLLLVEDNPDDEVLTLRALRKHQPTDDIVVKRDGQEALDYLLSCGESGESGAAGLPRVVLLDLKLPKVNGLQVLERLRADPHTRYIPVVILTSSDEERDIVRSYDLGVNGYVRKPVDFQHFDQAVRHLGYYWLDLNETPYGRG